MANEELIVLKQLPVIEEHLEALAAQIDQRVDAALSLVATEDTCKSVKATRADLNKEFQELEDRRKAIKAAIMEPYDRFNEVYNRCVAVKYKTADATLRGRVAAVEDAMKARKEESLRQYYGECCEVLHIPGIPFERIGLNITLSASEKALRSQIDSFLQSVSDGLEMIQNRDDRDEVLVEFWKSLNAAQAVNTVEARRRAVAEEKARADARAAEEKADRERAAAVEARMRSVHPAVSAPEEVSPPPPPGDDGETVLRVQFTVTGTREKLKALKKFLIDGGYQYE